MNVTIKTEFGEMTFQMGRESAMALMQKAMDLENADKPKSEAKESAPVEVAKPVPVPRARHSRTETMFGSRETWNHQEERKANLEGYKGFLHIQCEACGKTKTFCAKQPTTFQRCECGHVTELKDLIPAHVRCKCGGDYKYQTNMRDPHFTIDCLGCKAPVDMELNSRGTAYVPMAERTVLWGGTADDPYVLRPRRYVGKE